MESNTSRKWMLISTACPTMSQAFSAVEYQLRYKTSNATRAKNYVKKTCFKVATKLKLRTGLILSLNRMLISVAYQTAPQPVKSVEYQLRY